jgi:hypothetical protein
LLKEKMAHIECGVLDWDFGPGKDENKLFSCLRFWQSRRLLGSER